MDSNQVQHQKLSWVEQMDLEQQEYYEMKEADNDVKQHVWIDTTVNNENEQYSDINISNIIAGIEKLGEIIQPNDDMRSINNTIKVKPEGDTLAGITSIIYNELNGSNDWFVQKEGSLDDNFKFLDIIEGEGIDHYRRFYSKHLISDDAVRLTNMLRLEDKLLICHAMRVNLILIDLQLKKAWYTRACDTNKTLCLLLTNEELEGCKSKFISAVGVTVDDVEIVRERFMTRVELSNYAEQVLFQGECVDTLCDDFYDNKILNNYTEYEYDYNTNIIRQCVVRIDSVIKLDDNFLPFQKKCDNETNVKNTSILPPRPQIPTCEYYDIESYKLYARQIYNKGRNVDNYPVQTSVMIKPTAKPLFSGVYNYISMAGNYVENCKQVGIDMEEWSYLYSGSIKRLWLNEVDPQNAVVTIMRYYLAESDKLNGKTIVITMNAVLNQKGKVVYVIVTPSYLERVQESMLTSFIYKILECEGSSGKPILAMEYVGHNGMIGDVCNSKEWYGIIEDMAFDIDLKDSVQQDLSDDNVRNTETQIGGLLIRQILKLEKYVNKRVDYLSSANGAISRKSLNHNKNIIHYCHTKEKIDVGGHIYLSRKHFIHYRPFVAYGMINDTNRYYYNLPSHVRWALAPRINERSRSIDDERCATVIEAEKKNISFTTKCKPIDFKQTNGIIKMSDDNKSVIMPCGFKTTSINPMLHRHECTKYLNSLQNRSKNLTSNKHNEFQCVTCGMRYHNNILSLICCE